jgi:hypothetical protein
VFHMGKEAWRVAAGPAVGPRPADRSYEGLKLGSLSHIVGVVRSPNYHGFICTLPKLEGEAVHVIRGWGSPFHVSVCTSSL